MKWFLSFVFILTGAACGWSEESSKPSIFVAPLDGDVSAILGWQPALGEGLAEMLITDLTKLNKFEVLESTALKELVGEVELGEAGYVSKEEKVDKGGFKGADFMFRGKVVRFGAKKQDVDLTGFVPKSIGTLGVEQQVTDVQIDWRIVDAYARTVLKTGTATATHKGTGFNIGVAVSGHGGNVGYNNKDFLNSALGKATVKAVSNIVTQVAALELPQSGRRKAQEGKQVKQATEAKATQEAARSVPGKVLAVPTKGIVIVSLGSKLGFKNGDKLNLYETVDTKDENGKVVFTDEKLVGELTLDVVQEDRSKATYGGELEVKSGWVVKAK